MANHMKRAYYWPNRLHAHRKSRSVLLVLSCRNQSKSMLYCCSKNWAGLRWNFEFNTRLSPLHTTTLKDHSCRICSCLLVPIGHLILCDPLMKTPDFENQSQNSVSAYLHSWPPSIWKSLPAVIIYILDPPIASGNHCLQCLFTFLTPL